MARKKKNKIWEKTKEVASDVGSGFRVMGAAYNPKNLFTGKSIKKAKEVTEKLKTNKNKEKLKARKYKTAREKGELENRIKIGDAKITLQKEKHKKSQAKRAKMNKLRKENPERYRRIKKREAAKELKSQYRKTKSGKYVKKRINSSEWD